MATPAYINFAQGYPHGNQTPPDYAVSDNANIQALRDAVVCGAISGFYYAVAGGASGRPNVREWKSDAYNFYLRLQVHNYNAYGQPDSVEWFWSNDAAASFVTLSGGPIAITWGSDGAIASVSGNAGAWVPWLESLYRSVNYVPQMIAVDSSVYYGLTLSDTAATLRTPTLSFRALGDAGISDFAMVRGGHEKWGAAGKLEFLTKYDTGYNPEVRMRIHNDGTTVVGNGPIYGVKFGALGDAKFGALDNVGKVGLGDISAAPFYVGIYRGGLGLDGGGNWLNIGGYDGVAITTGGAAFGSQALRMKLDNAGNAFIYNKLSVGPDSMQVGVLQANTFGDETVAYFNIKKNDGGAADVISIFDERGYSGGVSGASIKIRSWGTTSGAMIVANAYNGGDIPRFYVNNDGTTFLNGWIVDAYGWLRKGPVVADAMLHIEGHHSGTTRITQLSPTMTSGVPVSASNLVAGWNGSAPSWWTWGVHSDGWFNICPGAGGITTRGISIYTDESIRYSGRLAQLEKFTLAAGAGTWWWNTSPTHVVCSPNPGDNFALGDCKVGEVKRMWLQNGNVPTFNGGASFAWVGTPSAAAGLITFVCVDDNYVLGFKVS